MIKKSIILFDGNCGFCRRRILEWKKITKNDIVYKASKSIEKIILIRPDKTLASGAGAIFEFLSPYSNLAKILYILYKNKIFSKLSEDCYQLVSNNRSLLSKIW